MATDRPTTERVSAPVSAPVALKLRVAAGPDFGRELVTEHGTYSVGSGDDNDLQLNDSAVSRQHLWIEVLAASLRITDRGSTNGSLCEGARFTSMEVRPGMDVQVGRSILRVLPVTSVATGPRPSDNESFGKLRGQSIRMRETFAVLERIARADGDVLIVGETGTGKELCAQELHRQSARAQGPFVVCDLAAISKELFESELFGHVKGSFTGASVDRAGVFEQARGGTVFLDEVGELPLEVQPRFLRVLEQREVKPVGSSSYVQTDVRVIAATHRDLGERCKKGQFREDLFHRLSVLRVHLPPLRERLDDLPFIIDDFLAQLGKPPSELSGEVRTLLRTYPWPGNVRELRNCVERVVSLGVVDLPQGPPPHRAAVDSAVGSPDANVLSFHAAKERMINAFEREYLVALLDKFSWNVKRAAENAGINRVHLYRLMKKHGIEER